MNTREYTAALEKFIGIMSAAAEIKPEVVAEASADLCSVLKIGMIEISYYKNGPLVTPEKTICVFSAEEHGSEFITKRRSAPDYKYAEYTIYTVSDEVKWSDSELERIDTFISLLSTYNVKSRMTNVANMLTYYDNDLDMYNLKHYLKCLGPLCRGPKISGYAAAFLNLKRFSGINKRFGRENGTNIMKKYIARFNDILDDDELICRAGGDNFVFLIKREKLDSALDIINGVNILVDDNRPDRVKVAASAGIYVIDPADCPLLPSDIMDKVSLAFHVAKNTGKKNIVYFDDDLLKEIEHINYVTAIFPTALENKEFIVYYQPKISLDGCHIAGAEALCRWKHEGKLIPPIDFIPVLEQDNNICRLDFYMLDLVCQDIRRWLDSGKQVVKVSVNLSRRHLSDDKLLEHIVEILDRYNVPRNYIEIELTETTNEDEFDDLKRAINGLCEAGISTSVDDFGIGYSSLEMIKALPWNVLKLDKSMLPEENDENAQQKTVMFKHVVAMAQEMGLECIAEGVETKEQVQLLTENRCNIAQGYFFDKPLPVEEFETRLDNYSYEV